MGKQIAGILLSIFVLFSCVSCSQPVNSEQTQPATMIDVQIVYKNNQICYSIIENGDDTSLYMFNAAAQPIYDIYGLSATAADLQPVFRFLIRSRSGSRWYCRSLRWCCRR